MTACGEIEYTGAIEMVVPGGSLVHWTYFDCVAATL
jgi:hypothetical protein